MRTVQSRVIKKIIITSIFSISILGITLPYQAQASEHMPTAKAVTPPMGFLKYCRNNLQECMKRSAKGEKVRLTKAKYQQLVYVQRKGNQSLRPASDLTLVGLKDDWSTGRNGYGDCEDYSLVKKKMLMAKGWPASALLLTTAITEQGEPHVVLTAVTDQGDIILDNRFDGVKDWKKMGYRWLSRQAPTSPMLWMQAAVEQDGTAYVQVR